MKSFKQVLAGFVAGSLVVGVMSAVAPMNHVLAAERGGSFSVLSYNVGGLPAIISSSSPAEYTTQISPKLNQYDIVNVQEDFAYNKQLTSQMTLPYRTSFSGNVPFGDGMMTFSKFPLCMETRVAWEDTYGFISNGADQMTPKGFTYTSVEIEAGYFVDVYNLHTDADTDDGSMEARRSNMRQLAKYINERSAGKAVIVFGDTNSRYTRSGDNFEEAVLETCGLTDAWVQLVRGGVAPADGDSLMVWELGQQGEVVDKIWYRSGKNVELTATSFRLLETEFTDAQGNQLSDHYPITSRFEYTLKNMYMTSDTFGGGGGRGFSFLDSMKDQLPESVSISTGKRVNNVSFTYDGKKVTAGGSEGKNQTLVFRDNEYITSVTVSKGKKTTFGTNRIVYIKITTNMGRSIEGGTYAKKASMTYRAPEGYAIAGFLGAEGDEIDRLGCIYQLVD